MKKTLLIITVVAALGIISTIVLTSKDDTNKTIQTTATTIITSTPTNPNPTIPPTNTVTSTVPSTIVTTPVATAGVKFKTGTYKSKIATNRYGDVQVQISTSADKITAISFLQYPTDERESQRINTRATPILVQQGLSAQANDIDGVSGASFTTKSYKESLQSAIDQAKL
jgi:uncharacterized protein with FMN-binding domain